MKWSVVILLALGVVAAVCAALLVLAFGVGPKPRLVPSGKRAMAVALTDHGGLNGVLYPGSIVDVLASFKSKTGEGLSTTLVSGVEVLAIERHTLILEGDKQTDKSLLATMEDRFTAT